MSKKDSNSNKTPNPSEPAAEPAASPASAQSAATPAAEPAAATPAEKTYSKAEYDAAIQAAADKAKKDLEKAQADEAARAQMSKEEQLEHDLATVRRENELIKAESEVVAALTAAGAKSPKLLFDAKQNALQFKDGKLTNLTEVVADLKLTYADQFGEAKPAESIDAGAGTKTPGKERAATLGDALKLHYQKK